MPGRSANLGSTSRDHTRTGAANPARSAPAARATSPFTGFGNQSVQRYLRPQGWATPSLTEASAQGHHAFGGDPVRPVEQLFGAGAVQAKLRISQPDDPDEREAGRVAGQIMRMAQPGPISRAAGAIQRDRAGGEEGTCAECAAEEKLQRQEQTGHAARPGPAAHARMAALHGDGEPLPASLRAFFEPRFDADFSQVRVHTGSTAAEAAQAIDAKAFTAGQDVVFAQGEYAPDSVPGRALLAHELTHTLQQKNAAEVVPTIQRDARSPAATACAVPQDDYTGVGPALPEMLDLEVASIQVSSFPTGTFDLLRRMLATYGEAGVRIYVDHLLQRMWVEGGPKLVDQFVDRFVYPIQLEYSQHLFDGDPVASRALMIGGIVLAAQTRIHADSDSFIACFKANATATAIGVLDESEQRVTGELQHYFGSALPAPFFLGPDDDIEDDPRTEQQDAASTSGLGIAAEGLAKRRNALIKANAEYRAAIRTQRMPNDEEQARALTDYETFRQQVVPRFPVLEEVSSPTIHPMEDEDAAADDEQGEQLNDLGRMAHGGDSEAGRKTILSLIQEKLGNIAKIREELLKTDGEVNVWQVPKIVEATSELTGARPGSFYAKLVEAKVNEEPPRSLTSRLIEIVEIGLYLLAPFTEGVSLIPAVALTAGRSGYRVYEHWKEYETQKALRGTDFGAAALSAEDPSLIWLAADIAGAFIEVGLSVEPALKVFKELAPAARAARAALAGEEAVGALENAARDLTVKELGTEQADKFAKAVARDALAAEHGGTAGMTAEEAEMLEAEDIVINQPPGRAAPESPAQADLLAKSSVIEDGKALSPAEHDAELELVAKSDPQPSSVEGYEEEVDLGNGHTWRRNANDTWCRFSAPTPSLCGTRIAGVPPLRGRVRVGSLPPFNYRVEETTLATLPRDAARNIEPLRDGVVYEFPGGHRVWREGEVIRHDSMLGPSSRRAGLELEFYSAGESGIPEVAGMERAHTLGQGTGFESPFGIFWAPREVNQVIQNNGIEELFRGLQESAAFGESFEVATMTTPHPGTLRLKEIRYRVSLVRNRQKDFMFEYVINVSDGPNPTVTHELANIGSNVDVTDYLDLVDVPQRVRSRFARWSARHSGGR